MPDHARPEDARVDPQRVPSAGLPRWLKLSAILVIVLAVAIAAMLLVAGGEHGPGRHSARQGTASPAGNHK
jgi:hypothetical protein